MEYNKLLENNISRKGQNVSSLFRFIKEGQFETSASSLSTLSEITESSLCAKLGSLRDKKFGHSDSDSINNPWKIKGFSGDEINTIVHHLRLILGVIQNCFNELGKGLIMEVPSRDDRTKNFIRFHSVYQKYYHDNFNDAWSRGYRIE